MLPAQQQGAGATCLQLRERSGPVHPPSLQMALPTRRNGGSGQPDQCGVDRPDIPVLKGVKGCKASGAQTYNRTVWIGPVCALARCRDLTV